MTEIGFDLSSALLAPISEWRSGVLVALEAARAASVTAQESSLKRTPLVVQPQPPSSTTTRGLTTLGLHNYCGSSTTRGVEGREFLEALPYSVDDVRARARRVGRDPGLKTPEFVTWKIRLAVEEGVVAPAQVNTIALPDSFNPATKLVWHGFVLLLACKWLYAFGEPTVFSREFAAPWSGVSVQQANDGITTMKRAGYMIEVGKFRRSTLWLPRSPE
jgi:hypothetical protein